MSTSPRSRARSFLRWLQKDDCIAYDGVVVFTDDAELELARVIAEALDELREGFMRKPRKDPTTNG